MAHLCTCTPIWTTPSTWSRDSWPCAYVALPHGVPHTFRVVSDQPAVMLQVHTDDSFLRFVKTVGWPATSRTLPAGPPAADMDTAFKVAAETGQPVIGPPMTGEEAAVITAEPTT